MVIVLFNVVNRQTAEVAVCHDSSCHLCQGIHLGFRFCFKDCSNLCRKKQSVLWQGTFLQRLIYCDIDVMSLVIVYAVQHIVVNNITLVCRDCHRIALKHQKLSL